MHYIKLMRPHHYVKNGLLFLPLIFSGQFAVNKTLLSLLMCVASFCLLSSVVYVVNDIKDVEADKQHPRKKNRPIASGEITIAQAVIYAGVLLISSAALLFFAGVPPLSWLIWGAYLVINAGYSVFGLKHIALLDIALLVSGFLLRVLFGSVVTGIAISDWLYLTVIAISFYLALGKRRNELKLKEAGKSETRKVLRGYSFSFLDKNMYVCLGEAIVFYSLWSVDGATKLIHANSGAIWTVPLIILISMRYSSNIEGDSEGDPTDVILKDKVLLSLVGLYMVAMFFIIYGI